MNFWEAFDSLEPIGEHREQTALLCSKIANLAAMIGATNGVKIEPSTAADFMPARYALHEKQDKEEDCFEQVNAQLKASVNG